ncbi:MAG TPA: hypothetical protein VH637_24135 [Streptosporangiaceae bacterium]|jgi:hypothetical protein
MNGMLRVPRSRGALSGVLLILLGVWGSLIAFVGPYFQFAYTPDQAWTYTSGRFWLEILPGVAAIIGGLVVLSSAYRPVALAGAWLAALSGAWFTIGIAIGPVWQGAGLNPGTPVGGPLHHAAEQIGFFTGLGVVIAGVAAIAIGRLSVISVRDARLAERALADEATPDDDTVASRPRTGPLATMRRARRPAAAPRTSSPVTSTSTTSKPLTSRLAAWSRSGTRRDRTGADSDETGERVSSRADSASSSR